MIGFIRAVTNGETSKELGTFFKKCIAAVIIFLIPTLVNIIVDKIGIESDYLECFKYANAEGIKDANNKLAKEYVLTAKNTLNYGSYVSAMSFVNKLEDESTK